MALPVPLTPRQRELLADVSRIYQPPVLPHTTREDGILRLGLIADPQYADIAADVENNLYYRHGLRKLPGVLARLNQQPLDLVITLGDLVDRHWESYAALLPLYQQLQHPHAVVPGNHDAQTIVGQLNGAAPLPKSYYALRLAGWRLVFYDGNDISLYCQGEERRQAEAWLADLTASGQPQAQPWNGAVGGRQWQWIEGQLRDARACGKQIAAFGHYPLAPHNGHILWNGVQLAQLFSDYNVRACFAGHDHRGGYARQGDTEFITLKGMLDGPEAAPFAVVEITARTLTVKGYGGEIDRQSGQ